jgi:hypothetical protein
MNPPSGLLPAPQFAAACEAPPLVSIDLMLTDEVEELGLPEIAALTLPAGDGEQHAAWQWMPLRQAEHDAGVHAHVRAYAAWVRGERRLAGGLAG